MDDYCCRFNKDCYSMAALGFHLPMPLVGTLHCIPYFKCSDDVFNTSN
jgi:hypothetical protein